MNSRRFYYAARASLAGKTHASSVMIGEKAADMILRLI
jgi:hypothetical protein